MPLAWFNRNTEICLPETETTATTMKALAAERPSILFALAFLLLSVLPAAAQETGTVTGTITTEEGRIAAGINVLVENTQIGTAADENGQFRVEQVPAGRQVLVVSGIGYSKKRRAIDVEAGRTTRVNLTISPSVLRLEEVTVVSSRSTFNEQYMASKSSDQVDSETTSDFNSANTYDALRLIPGVSFMTGQGGRTGAPSRIRGGSAWKIPDAIDDFPSTRESGIGAEDGGLTAGLGASVPAVALENISVNKGSLGVLYGGGADGGVISNQIERGQPGPPTGALSLELNPIAEQLAMGDVGGGTETYDYYVAGKALHGEYRDLVDAQRRDQQSDQLFSGLAKLGYNPRSDMRLELLALRGRDQIRYNQYSADDPETPDVDESTEQPHRFRTTNTNQFYGLTFDHTLTDALSYEMGYSEHRVHALRYSLTEDQAHRDRPQRTHTLFGNGYIQQSLSEAIDYSGRVGFEALRHNQEENARGSTKDQQFSDYSVFTANTLWADNFSFSGGVRYTYGTDSFDEHHMLSFDGGASYTLPRVDTKLRTSYSTGYSRNKGFAYFFGPIEAAGGVDLTENRTFEVGADQPYNLGGSGNNGKLRLTAFRTINNGVPTFSGWGAQTVYYEDRRVRGLEVALDQRIVGNARLFGSFTYMKTEVVSTTHPEGINVGNTGVRVPRYTGSAGLELSPLNRLDLTLIGTYDDGMRNRQIDTQTGEETITIYSAYTRVNFAADYRINPTFSTEIRVENLLDQEQFGSSFETIGPDGYSRTETRAENPGRFISLGLTMNF